MTERRRPVRMFNEEDDAFVRGHYREMTYAEMAEALGVSLKQVQHSMRRLGLKKDRWSVTHYKQQAADYEHMLKYVRDELSSGRMTRDRATALTLEINRTLEK